MSMNSRKGIGHNASATPLKAPPASGKLNAILSLDDFEPLARRRLPGPLFGYIAGGCERNNSLEANRICFLTYGFKPHVLRDVSRRTTRTRIFGTEYAAPVGIAPMGMSALMAYRGDVVLASAAAELGVPMIMSGASLTRLEEIAQVAPDTWFQAYISGDQDKIDALVERIAAAGFKTLVITVDTQVLPSRENNIRAGFSTPLRPTFRLAWEVIKHPRWAAGTFGKTLVHSGIPHFENSYAGRGEPIISRTVERDFSNREHLSWRHLERVRKRWRGNLVVKGIVQATDAKACVDLGAEGIIVSNHGGRQLDGTVPSIEVLPEICREVGDAAVVMIDGGIRRGTDVVKAIALGAKFVFVGRPFLYAAVVGGESGVCRAIELLSTEVHRTMGMLGVNSLDELNANFLQRCWSAPSYGHARLAP